MTDYRALCANLTAALNDWQCRTDDDGYAALIDCARAALAEQPVAPTDDLSPAAQSVLDAATVPTGDFCLENVNEIAAAALRAVAAQMFPINYVVIDNCQYEVPNPEREQILAIAAELEALPND